MIKKLIIYKLILSLLFFSVVSSAALQWDIAAIVGSVAGVAVTSAVVIGAAPIVVSGALAVGVHATVLALYWNSDTPALNASGTASATGIRVIINPETPFITPPGWTATASEPIPPSTVQPIYYGSDLNPTNFSGGQAHHNDYLLTASEAITAMNLRNGNNWVVVDNPPTTDWQGLDNTPCGGQPTRLQQFGYPASKICMPQPGCPTGYKQAIEGGSCQLIYPKFVNKPSDNTCEISTREGTFQVSERDPDCGNLPVHVYDSLTSSYPQYSMDFVSPDKAVYLKTSSNGTVTVYQKTYNTEKNQTISSIGSFDVNGDVTFLNMTVALGKALEFSGGGSGGGGSTEGLAKDSSLQTTDGGDEPVADSGAESGGVTHGDDGIKTSLNPLNNWSVPVGNGSCPVGNFDVFETTITLDSHCAIFDANATVIQQAMGVVFTIAALFIILGA